MKTLVDETLTVWKALGEARYGTTEKEKASSIFRRSVYVVKDVEAGEEFTTENLRIIRPGDGLHPRDYERILGKKASFSIKKGTPMDWKYVNKSQG